MSDRAGRSSFATEFAAGASAPWRGLATIARTPRLLSLALAPTAISALLFVCGTVWALGHLQAAVESFTLDVAASPAGSRPMVYFAALALAWPAFIGALAFAVFLAARILSGPFNSALAARASARFGRKPGVWTGHRFLRMAMVSLAQELALAAFGIGLFFASFVPVINALAVGCYFLLVAFDCSTYALEGRDMGLLARFAVFQRRFPVYAGFAGSIAVLFLVPGLGFMAYPIGVVGGAWLDAHDWFAAQ